jgi:hypothetical protein
MTGEPIYQVHQVAADARAARAQARAAAAGCDRRELQRVARRLEGLVQCYVRAIERGCTPADSAVMRAFEG